MTVPGRGRSSRDGIRVHRTSNLESREIRTKDGLRLTSPARTLLDMAEATPTSELRRAFGEAHVLRLVRTHEIEDLLERCPGRRGGVPIRALLREGRPLFTRSELERRFLVPVQKAGLPCPSVNVRVAGYEVDFSWAAERVIVETDGLAFHGHHTAIERDRRKDLDLQSSGHRLLRVTHRQVADEGLRLAARLGAVLSAPAPDARTPRRSE